MNNMIALIILLALLQYGYFTYRVGQLRSKYGVPAPKCTGNETWERVFRVQQNTLEQLIVFVPGMLLFAQYVSVRWALLPGVVFLVGRAVYSYLYINSPGKRSPGAFMTLASNAVLLIGSLIGVGMSLMA